MKKIIGQQTPLAHPDFNSKFEMHTDASHTQLGAAVSQNGNPMAFFSGKLNPAQTRCTTTERELLATVETLKEFRNILLGQHTVVHADHKNPTHKTFNTERVMRWRLIIEECDPELVCIKGESNTAADALSRPDINNESPLNDSEIAENYGADEDDLPPFPLTIESIQRAQQADDDLLLKLKDDSHCAIKDHHAGDKKRSLIVKDD